MCAIYEIPVGALPLHFGPFSVRSISSSEMASEQNSLREGFGGSCALWPLVSAVVHCAGCFSCRTSCWLFQLSYIVLVVSAVIHCAGCFSCRTSCSWHSSATSWWWIFERAVMAGFRQLSSLSGDGRSRCCLKRLGRSVCGFVFIIEIGINREERLAVRMTSICTKCKMYNVWCMMYVSHTCT